MTGARYDRGGGQAGYARWGRQRGSVYLGDQKVAVTVPRARDLGRGQKATLASYQAWGRPRRAKEAALLNVLKGLSCRDYEAWVDPMAETFGLVPMYIGIASLQAGRCQEVGYRSCATTRREAKAELAMIVSVALPADLSTFALIDRVWVTSGACVVGLATALLPSLIEMNATKQAEHGR